MRDAGGGLAAVRQQQSQVRADDRVVGLDCLRGDERPSRRVDLLRAGLARGAPEVRVGARQVGVDGDREAPDRVGTAPELSST
jgi:hypothetical protein